MRAHVLAAALGTATTAHADSTVEVTLSPAGEALAARIGASLAELTADIEARIDDAYATADVAGFLGEFADATSFAGRGIGVDYASTSRGLIAGLAANISAAGDTELEAPARPTAGLAANLTVMVGLNLAEWGHPRWTVFANGFYRDAATERLDGDILDLGAHVSYRLRPAAPGDGDHALLRWIGVAATSGIELSRWQLGTGDEPLSTGLTVTGAADTAALELASTGRLDLSATAVTVPVEVSTGMRIAVLATLYVGAAVDLTAGTSGIDAALDGTLTDTQGRDVGAVRIRATGDTHASPVSVRALAGVQVNLWRLRLFSQVNVSQAPAASIAVGLRFSQ